MSPNRLTGLWSFLRCWLCPRGRNPALAAFAGPNDKYYIMSSFNPKNKSIVLGNTLETFYKIGATT
jgi:hypothetical protein